MKGSKVLLVIAGLLAIGIGLAMMFATAAFLAPQGIAVDAKVAVLGQAQGSLLAGLGVLDLAGVLWAEAGGLRAICAGNLATHLLALVVNARALSAHVVNHSVFGDVVGHVIFALAFAAAIVALGRRTAT